MVKVLREAAIAVAKGLIKKMTEVKNTGNVEKYRDFQKLQDRLGEVLSEQDITVAEIGLSNEELKMTEPGHLPEELSLPRDFLSEGLKK